MSRHVTVVFAELIVNSFTVYAEQTPPKSPDWVSAFSVRKRDLCIFMPVLIAIWAATVAMLAYVQYASEPMPFVFHIVPERNTDSGHIYQVYVRFGQVVIPLVATAMAVTYILKVGVAVARALYLLLAHRLPRRVAMTIVNFLRRSYLERRVDELRAEGVAIGNAQTNQVWQEWNRRRMAAESEGRVFSEPPPA